MSLNYDPNDTEAEALDDRTTLEYQDYDDGDYWPSDGYDEDRDPADGGY